MRLSKGYESGSGSRVQCLFRLVGLLVLSFLPLTACQPEESEAPESQAQGTFLPNKPLDDQARAAARSLLANPEQLTLAGANGLERLGVRFEELEWVRLARSRFEERLASDRPLSPEEAVAFRERWRELDLDPRWPLRLQTEGLPLDADPPYPTQSPQEALLSLLAMEEETDPNLMLSVWGRVHAWFGHVWMDGEAGIFSFDGIEMTREKGGWKGVDLLNVRRDFTLRRAKGHDSMRHMAPGGSVFLPDQIGED